MPNPDKTMKPTELRGLESFLAEHVMGLDVSARELRHVGRGIRMETIPSPTGRGHCQIPNYTTDPAAAMAILRKCHSTVTISLRKQTDGTTCAWWTDPDGSCEHHVFGDTLELAICKAARRIFKTA